MVNRRHGISRLVHKECVLDSHSIHDRKDTGVIHHMCFEVFA
jgi:hypothetical protein